MKWCIHWRPTLLSNTFSFVRHDERYFLEQVILVASWMTTSDLNLGRCCASEDTSFNWPFLCWRREGRFLGNECILPFTMRAVTVHFPSPRLTRVLALMVAYLPHWHVGRLNSRQQLLWFRPSRFYNGPDQFHGGVTKSRVSNLTQRQAIAIDGVHLTQ